MKSGHSHAQSSYSETQSGYFETRSGYSKMQSANPDVLCELSHLGPTPRQRPHLSWSTRLRHTCSNGTARYVLGASLRRELRRKRGGVGSSPDFEDRMKPDIAIGEPLYLPKALQY